MLTRRAFITGIGAALIVMKVQGFRVLEAQPRYITATDAIAKQKEMAEVWAEACSQFLHEKMLYGDFVFSGMETPKVRWFTLKVDAPGASGEGME